MFQRFYKVLEGSSGSCDTLVVLLGTFAFDEGTKIDFCKWTFLVYRVLTLLSIEGPLLLGAVVLIGMKYEL